MKRKVLAVALPITLALAVGCSNKDVAEEKKTDSLKVSETDSKKDVIKPLYAEVGKIYEEGQDVTTKREAKEKESSTKTDKESTSKNEDSTDKPVKEAIIGGGRTLAEEREHIGKQLHKGSSQSSPLEQYQEEVKETSKDLSTAVQSSKSLIEKDETLKTNQSGLKGQLSVISGRVNRLATIDPPEGYYYFKEQLRDDAKVIKQVVDQAFIALNENDTEKAKANIDYMMEYLDTMSSTLNEIQNVQNGV
ncbi:hypothetical protein ACFVV6_24455 [Bacillus mycoides]|uniref:Lipoprotein n=1 Tax=Bacillus mycoides TaxID=1405 RepID=A0AAP8KUV1_BACMY|nr:hypothetical protein [Bacillus mycoides]AJH16867.1 hypothetical protein BG05_5554 [Bacillus mycoides]EEL95928.1 hypothetical protein bmyco0001_56670 [Bacillus mycoides DSM 2048]EOO34653.1 hypothetical protein IKK_05458 [Bacillus mycoides]KMQ14708.1 hypothetical protein TU70_21770 [Bacillus mycoides]KUH40976.1 hypothetical protein M2E15_4759 [Bacillus mycoides]